MAKIRAGVMACEGQNCESHDIGAPVVVFTNERETLSYSCQWCGRAPYARPGTGQYSEWQAAMKLREKPAPAPSPAPDKKEAAPVPVPPVEKTKPAKGAGLLIG